MKSNGNRYSPAFKFRVVLKALKAEGKGAEAQVAQVYGVHPPALANWKEQMKGRHALSIAHHSSRITHHGFYYRSPMEYLASEGFVPKTLAEIGPKSGSVPGAHIQ